MKRLLLVRHAKSDWSDGSLRDFDRPLNRRGQHDAPRMARYVKGRGVAPTFLLTSPAARTYATARLFADELGVAENDIGLREALYECTAAELLAAIRELPEPHDTVALFAHNPATTSVVGRFADDYVANVPTCGVALVESAVAKWSEVGPAVGRLADLWVPKTVLRAYAR